MARNRRDSTSMTFAIGRGCFLLLVGAVCVGFSVTKIIVGSEYVSMCPSREMIPVYVLVSGCLPVLLSALRQPYDAGHATDKERCSMKISLVTAVVGVMVNLAWLVAGTYLVVTTWNGNICKIPVPHNVTGTAVSDYTATSQVNGTLGSELGNNPKNSIENTTQFSSYTVVTKHDESYIDSQSNFTSERVRKQTEAVTDGETLEKVKNRNATDTKTQYSKNEQFGNMAATSDSIQKSNEITSANQVEDTESGVTVTSDKNSLSTRNNSDETIQQNVTEVSGNHKEGGIKNSDTIFASGGIGVKSTTDAGGSVNKPITSNFRTQTVLIQDSEGSRSQERLCITCDIHILRFSLAVVVIDWTFVMIGMVYFCHFVYHRFASLKDQLLLINA